MEHIVYVVDDDHAVRRSVVGLLESAGLNALDFSSAESFLQHTFEDVPSCVILDMQMPTISGFEVADTLKASGREIPIIYLTGHGTIPMSVKAMKGGAYEFLTKPVASNDLIDSIGAALKWRKRMPRTCASSTPSGSAISPSPRASSRCYSWRSAGC